MTQCIVTHLFHIIPFIYFLFLGLSAKNPGFSDCSQILGSNVWLCGHFSWPAHVPRTCKRGICPPNALPQHWLAPTARWQLSCWNRLASFPSGHKSFKSSSSRSSAQDSWFLPYMNNKPDKGFLQTATTSKTEGMMQHLTDETFKYKIKSCKSCRLL